MMHYVLWYFKNVQLATKFVIAILWGSSSGINNRLIPIAAQKQYTWICISIQTHNTKMPAMTKYVFRKNCNALRFVTLTNWCANGPFCSVCQLIDRLLQLWNHYRPWKRTCIRVRTRQDGVWWIEQSRSALRKTCKHNNTLYCKTPLL